MKIRVFRFRVSNPASYILRDDEKTEWFNERKCELYCPEEIEEIVNDFINSKGVKVIDIKVNTVEVHYHNNARGNTVDLVYTIMYEEQEV